MKSGLLFIFLLFNTSLPAQKFWLTTFSFPGGPKTAITTLSDSILIVGTVQGIVRSFDQGVNFDTLFQGTYIYGLYYSKSGSLFAGGEGMVYRSHDQGNTWDTIQGLGDYPVRSFVENSQGELFCITGIFIDTIGFLGAGVFFSPDDGETWTPRNNGLTSTLSCDAIAIDKNDRLYIGIADDLQTGEAGLFYSDNAGEQWQQVDITIDGRGVIDDQIRVYTISGISISPEDSVYVSIDGAAFNVGVNLNLHKSIQDIPNPSKWKVTNVAHLGLWWNDRQLFTIHFAQNGDRYSSSVGSTQLGKTWFSKDKGLTWHPHDEGLGLDIIGRRNIQYFSEISTGRIFMIQRFAELIHVTDTSVLMTSIPSLPPESNRLKVFPNPVRQNEEISITSPDEIDIQNLNLYDLTGRELKMPKSLNKIQTLNAPPIPGIYFLVARTMDKSYTAKIIVY